MENIETEGQQHIHHPKCIEIEGILKHIAETQSRIVAIEASSEERMGRVNEMISNLIEMRREDREMIRTLIEANSRQTKIIEEVNYRYDALLNKVCNNGGVGHAEKVEIRNNI